MELPRVKRISYRHINRNDRSLWSDSWYRSKAWNQWISHALRAGQIKLHGKHRATRAADGRGATECVISYLDAAGMTRQAIGYGFCSPDDNFEKRIGRLMSFRRAYRDALKREKRRAPLYAKHGRRGQS